MLLYHWWSDGVGSARGDQLRHCRQTRERPPHPQLWLGARVPSPVRTWLRVSACVHQPRARSAHGRIAAPAIVPTAMMIDHGGRGVLEVQSCRVPLTQRFAAVHGVETAEAAAVLCLAPHQCHFPSSADAGDPIATPWMERCEMRRLKRARMAKPARAQGHSIQEKRRPHSQHVLPRLLLERGSATRVAPTLVE